jgi:hypothetical protein
MVSHPVQVLTNAYVQVYFSSCLYFHDHRKTHVRAIYVDKGIRKLRVLSKRIIYFKPAYANNLIDKSPESLFSVCYVFAEKEFCTLALFIPCNVLYIFCYKTNLAQCRKHQTIHCRLKET